MTGQASEIQWYIARDGKQHGPLTDIEMRTFVAHSYLRTSDLIWRPGMPEWLAAPVVFPTAFEAQGEPQAAQTAAPRSTSQAPAATSATKQSKSAAAPRDTHSSDFDAAPEPRPERSIVKRLALASVAITVIGGGALAVASYRQPLMDMVSSSSRSTDTPPVVSAPAQQMKVAGPEPTAQPDSLPAADTASSSPQPPPSGSQTTTSSVSSNGPSSGSEPSGTAPSGPNQQVAAIDTTPPAPPPPPTIDGSPIDAKLQKVPVWALIKKEYPDWYSAQVTAANKMVADKKSDNDVAMLLAQGLVTLRRQNSEKALEASSEKLQQVAVAFLDHLKSLRSQSVSACFGFISKGETSPAVVQMMENPESATALNAQADAVFEAISEGTRNPVKHDSAVKSDYDILIKELSKLGWKEEDLQVFSNPKLLAKREPEQVCKMVQEWFVAHLAVPDKAVRDRLLFETLKPVVSG